MSAAASASSAKPGPRSARETMAKQQTALQGQVAKLEADLAAAETARNRAVAAASLDGSKAALAARDAAVGAVVRVEAGLSGARAALAQVERDMSDLDDRRAEAVRATKLKAAASAIRAMVADAENADKAAAQWSVSYQNLVAACGKLYSALPAHMREQVLGSGDLLGKRSIDATAEFLISRSGLIPRPMFAPSEHRQSLAALVAYFGKPVLDEAAAAPEPEEWD